MHESAWSVRLQDNHWRVARALAAAAIAVVVLIPQIQAAPSAPSQIASQDMKVLEAEANIFERQNSRVWTVRVSQVNEQQNLPRKPTIVIKKFVKSIYSAYEVEVFADYTVHFYGYESKNPRTSHQFLISEDQYRTALRAFDQAKPGQIEDELPAGPGDMASITIVRDGITRTVGFHKYSKLFAQTIQFLEENLALRSLICPRTTWYEGARREGCQIEDKIREEVLKGE